AQSWDSNAPLEISSIVAITFTRKAAAELQERLADSFRQLSTAASAAKEQNYWTIQVDELTRATVGTIDSFCARILRGFGWLEQGRGRIEPDFEPLERYEEGVLKREAIDRVLNRLSAVGAGQSDASEWAQVEACRWWAEEEGYPPLVRYLEILLNHFVAP